MAERPRRGSFGPVVLLGLAGGTLAAVAGNKPWARVVAGHYRDFRGPTPNQLMLGSGVDVGKMPVTTALALVVLAAWGVVLVTRGRVRRAVAVLGLLAAVGTLVAVVLGWSDTADSVRAAMVEAGQDTVGHTAWFWAAAVGAVVSVVAGAAAVRLTPSWPEMGSRYDAPADGSPRVEAPAVAPEDQTNLDLWKAMDEGRDPTA
ncbi:MAG: Trp biosynthesis-associated membrane protein [Nocardioides sp.]